MFGVSLLQQMPKQCLGLGLKNDCVHTVKVIYGHKYMKRNANLLQSQHLLQSVSSQKGSHFWKVRIYFVSLHIGTVLM
jgi:hypothetical protein